jgi:hypothetical protein
VVYSDEDRARIGRYASVNGYESARKHFLGEYPKLAESTIRNFKKMYLNQRETKQYQSPSFLLNLRVDLH